jgi:hypothetical protein
MVSDIIRPGRALDYAREAGAHSEHNSELKSSTDEAQLATPHSNSHDEISQPRKILQHRPKESPGNETGAETIKDAAEVTMEKFIIEVRVPPPERPWEYLRIPEEDIVEAVIEEIEHSINDLWYKVAFEDGREEEVSDMTSEIENLFQSLFRIRLFENVVHPSQSLCTIILT